MRPVETGLTTNASAVANAPVTEPPQLESQALQSRSVSLKRLPYGGTLLEKDEAKNELIDHSQYRRVMKQPSEENLIFDGLPNWAIS